MAMNSNDQHHCLHGDTAASVAPTPAKRSVMDFFQKISAAEYIKIQDAQIADLSQADIMDLRNVQVRSKQRCVGRTTYDFEGSVIYSECFAHLIISNHDNAEVEEDDDDSNAEEDAFLDEEDDDGALDILDLTAAAPSAPEPIDHEGPIHSF